MVLTAQQEKLLYRDLCNAYGELIGPAVFRTAAKSLGSGYSEAKLLNLQKYRSQKMQTFNLLDSSAANAGSGS